MKNEDLARFYPSKKKPKSATDSFLRKSDNNGGGGSVDFSTPDSVAYSNNKADITYDGGQELSLPVKGGNGIVVDAASDNKSLEVRIGDSIELTEDQEIYIGTGEGGMQLRNDGGTLAISFDGDATCAFQIDKEYADEAYFIPCSAMVLADNVGEQIIWAPLNPYYEIDGVPTSATSGTFAQSKDYDFLVQANNNCDIMFNKERYRLNDRQHTTGTMVWSHLGYEAGELVIKTITVTLATRAWKLTTIKPPLMTAEATFTLLDNTYYGPAIPCHSGVTEYDYYVSFPNEIPVSGVFKYGTDVYGLVSIELNYDTTTKTLTGGGVVRCNKLSDGTQTTLQFTASQLSITVTANNSEGTVIN